MIPSFLKTHPLWKTKGTSKNIYDYRQDNLHLFVVDIHFRCWEDKSTSISVFMKRDSSVVTFPFRLPMKINKLASTVIATVVCASFVQLAPAAVIVSTSQSFWNSYSASQGTCVSTETFNNLSGIYSAPVSGTAGSTAPAGASGRAVPTSVTPSLPAAPP